MFDVVVVGGGPAGLSAALMLDVAGDASRDMQFAVVAAAEGAKVACAINVVLQKEHRG